MGYMVAAIPWLNSRSWEGFGVALGTLPKNNDVQKSQRRTMIDEIKEETK